eukprot:363795-Chlamydomonas_euryale.AAC.10
MSGLYSASEGCSKQHTGHRCAVSHTSCKDPHAWAHAELLLHAHTCIYAHMHPCTFAWCMQNCALAWRLNAVAISMSSRLHGRTFGFDPALYCAKSLTASSEVAAESRISLSTTCARDKFTCSDFRTDSATPLAVQGKRLFSQQAHKDELLVFGHRHWPSRKPQYP